MTRVAPNRAFWGVAKWVARLAILCALLVGWRAYQMGQWWSLGGAAVAAFLLELFQTSAGRQALGWYIDDQGERQKVLRIDRGVPIYIPTTRSRRFVEEGEQREWRRKRLLASLFLTAGVSGFGLYLWPRWHTAGWLLFLVLPAGVGLVGAVPILITAGWAEILYLCGWQDMRGARVLDPEPARPGFVQVLNQKVHGDVGLANESEAVSLLKGK